MWHRVGKKEGEREKEKDTERKKTAFIRQRIICTKTEIIIGVGRQ